MNEINKENNIENNTDTDNNTGINDETGNDSAGTVKDSIIVRENNFISQSPHIWRGISSAKIMYIFFASLIFPSVAAVYFFGLRAFWVMFSSTVTAVLIELKQGKRILKWTEALLLRGCCLLLLFRLVFRSGWL